MGGSERAFVQEAFDLNWIAPSGPHLCNFENELSKLSKDFDVAALSSGTAAIHLALIIAGVQKDDNVICSSFTFSASANPIKYVGANPIFIDSEKESWNMCPELLMKAIKQMIKLNQKPKAIILVHLYGMPAKIEEIVNIANSFQIPIIEDAAEALGSRYKQQQLGTFTDYGVFSFNGNKIITTSGGGALVCNDKKKILKARFLATQARENVAHYEHKEVGYNYRMSNICAAIGLGQIKFLHDRVIRKREIFNFYKNALSSIKDITFLNETKGSFSNYWLTTILLNSNSTIDREKLRSHLAKYNIESRPLWKPMHLQPIFKDCKSYTNGVSEDLFNRGLCLPSGTSMKNKDLERVVSKIKELYEV
ncbi:MAG: pyridoxal phosphate-dependent aminotransferase [Flavobacteriales bacterium]|nr:pyridoxal phosphate-dependent aminotransferase [Flavobacteriales bacterium]